MLEGVLDKSHDFQKAKVCALALYHLPSNIFRPLRRPSLDHGAVESHQDR